MSPSPRARRRIVVCSAWILGLALALTLPLLPGVLAGPAAESPDPPQDQPQQPGKKKKDKKKKDKKKKDKKAPQPEAADPQKAAAEKEAEEEKRGGRFRFVMAKRPSIRVRKVARADFRVKSQLDFSSFLPKNPSERQPGEGLLDLHRMRVGVEGNFLKHFEYEFEYELRDRLADVLGIDPTEVQHPWRDAWVNFRYLRDFQIRAGKFKIPFSRDQLTGPTNLDFAFRSRLASQLAPARDIGIVAHGRFFRRALSYEAGIFKQDGENAEFTDDEPEVAVRTGSGLRTFAGRVTGEPLRYLGVPKALRRLELGGAFASTTVPQGLRSLRGRMATGETFFPRFFVHGHRLRIGTELNWEPGPFSLRGEFVHVSEERRGQSLAGRDLPNLVSRGWYLSGSWVVTGEKKQGGVEPRKDFLLERGLGAVELAGRWEALRFGSAQHLGRPLRIERASNVLGNSDRAWTVGVNWYWNRHIKIQFNAIRERIEDFEESRRRTPLLGHPIYWTRLCRVQFVL